MRVALVHDYLIQYGGAERVVEALHEAFPDAPLYTSVLDHRTFSSPFPKMDIRTSFLQRLPVDHRLAQRYLLPLYPLAFCQFSFQQFDLVISSASSFAKGVRVPSSACHICYCHSPTRFLWEYDDYVVREGLPGLARLSLRPLIWWLRRWDQEAATRVDHFVANSREVSSRIRAIYGREAVVIPPPVDLDGLRAGNERGDFYLVVSRLVPAKRIDLAIRAFNTLRRPLVIVGNGRDRSKLEQLAGPTVQFAGWVSRERLLEYYRRCRALILPGHEDFGIAPIEAQACGRPVVAFAGGGAMETVVDGETGLFFKEPTPENLADAVERLNQVQFSSDRIRAHAEQFSKAAFIARIRTFASDACAAHQGPSRGNDGAGL